MSEHRSISLPVNGINMLDDGCQIIGAAAAAIVLAPPRTALATPRPNQLSAAVAQLSAGALHPPFPLLSAGSGSSTSAPLISLPSRAVVATQRPPGSGSSTSAPLISLPSRAVVATQRPPSSTLSVIQSQRWMIYVIHKYLFPSGLVDLLWNCKDLLL